MADEVMRRHSGLAAEAYTSEKTRRFHVAARGALVAGVLATGASRRSRFLGALGGAALLSGSALTRFAIFESGIESARDPKLTVVPQRARMAARDSPAGAERDGS